MMGPTDLSFGDWMASYVPRLAMMEAAGLDCPVVIRRNPQAQALDILAALGVRRDRILFHDPVGTSLFPKLYAPAWPRRDKLRPVAGFYDVHRRAALTGVVGERPLLYLSRRNVSARRMVNEAEVCALFERRGFRIVDPGGLSFDEVRRLFANAACVAGPSGSAFHNLAFCAGKPVNLAISPPDAPRQLAEMAVWHAELGLRFANVRGESLAAPGAEFVSRQVAWRAPLDRVERALDRVLELIGEGG
jgi:capsular polysaccharide biosynthesis protein